jgi:hypothetical protein
MTFWTKQKIVVKVYMTIVFQGETLHVGHQKLGGGGYQEPKYVVEARKLQSKGENRKIKSFCQCSGQKMTIVIVQQDS